MQEEVFNTITAAETSLYDSVGDQSLHTDRALITEEVRIILIFLFVF